MPFYNVIYSDFFICHVHFYIKERFKKRTLFVSLGFSSHSRILQSYGDVTIGRNLIHVVDSVKNFYFNYSYTVNNQTLETYMASNKF